MKLTLKKINQKGFLSLHILVPAVLAIATIGGVGAYVFMKSSNASVAVDQRSQYAAKCTISGIPNQVKGGQRLYYTLSITNTGTKTFTPVVNGNYTWVGTSRAAWTGHGNNKLTKPIKSGQTVSYPISDPIPEKNGILKKININLYNAPNSKPTYSCQKSFTVY